MAALINRSLSPFPSSSELVNPLPLTKPRACSIIAMANPRDQSLPNQKSSTEIMRSTMINSDSKQPWWTPLFKMNWNPSPGNSRKTEIQAPDLPENRPKGQLRRSVLTAEKAKLLRKEIRATETWHDLMYHSAIASRLASPDQ
ncbi:hypothetical protein AMTRI_Chr09g16690 [Amborella trichopoda]|uniref:Uncharacterized protein n=1 Tax=Amborella trichopoda TaxID=13333 RepID=W1NM58_AMBTC|nr:uncharacterized protein LOC18424548 [Amborella trichopoda]ERM96613.1 hypothetical protein AMTR_s00001p00271500 [Amborella trichopoda]|eukprot:XP_006829197.1 uncharacterized protein LOC18424548 [Amborella trichopoda]